jgi:hypothetical protein
MEVKYNAFSTADTGTSATFTAEWPETNHVRKRPRLQVVGGTDFDQEASRRVRLAQEATMDLDAAFLEDYGTELNPESRDSFENFMRYNDVAFPMIGADSVGVIEATWSNGSDYLSIRFKDKHVTFAISYVQSGNRIRKWGESSLATFFQDCPRGSRVAAA